MTFCKISWTEESIASDGDNNTINSQLNIIEFDIVEKWTQVSEAEVTQYVVENGSPLTDHKKVLPKTIIIDGLVSNTPIGTPPPDGRGETSRIRAERYAFDEGTFNDYNQSFDRVQQCYDVFQDLVNSAKFVTIEMPQKVYERCTLKKLEDVREGSGGFLKGVRFRITAQEIFVGETRTVDIPVPLQPRGNRKEPTNTATEEAPATTEVPRSWALTVGQGIFG
jgi:hypothetical protein